MGKNNISSLFAQWFGMKSSDAKATVGNTQKEEGQDVPINVKPSDFIKELGADISYQDGDFYVASFQGGNFWLNFHGNLLTLIFPGFFNCSNSNRIILQRVADELNCTNSVWTAYTGYSEKDYSEKDPVKVSLSQTVHLDNDLGHTVGFTRSVMQHAFSVARDFERLYQKSMREEVPYEELLNQSDYFHNLKRTKCMVDTVECDRANEELSISSGSPLSIAYLRTVFQDADFGKMLSLSIVADNHLEIITDSEKMESFDIRAYIREHFAECPPQSITLSFTLEHEDLTIALRKLDGSDKRSVFYVLSGMRSGTDTDRYVGNMYVSSIRCNVEIRLTSDADDYWEGTYKIGELLDGAEKGEDCGLNHSQIQLLSQASEKFKKDIYWGMKYHNMGMYLQSLFFFRRVYASAVSTVVDGNYEEDYLPSVAFMLGVAYYNLEMYEQASYYLEKARRLNFILPHEYYINCLRCLRDEHVTQIIRDELSLVTQNFSSEEDEENFYPFYLFLKRSLVEQLIDEREYQEAMNMLNAMVEHEEEVEFAKENIVRLTSLRAEEAKQKVGSAESPYQWPDRRQ